MKPRIISTEILSARHHTFKQVNFELNSETQLREVLDVGDAATILLYKPEKKTVILSRQFRLPTYLHHNQSDEGYLIEACAGKLDGETPEVCIVRETHEELGYRIGLPEKLFALYQSPGTLSEIIHYYYAEVSESQKVGNGGGLASEHEHIDVVEIPFAEALAQVKSGKIKDAKTVILLQYLERRLSSSEM